MNILDRASEIVKDKWPRSKGWKVLVILLVIIGIVFLIGWLLVKLIRALTAGGFRNQDLYMPRMRRRL